MEKGSEQASEGSWEGGRERGRGIESWTFTGDLGRVDHYSSEGAWGQVSYMDVIVVEDQLVQIFGQQVLVCQSSCS